jgi:hypothetical protein
MRKTPHPGFGHLFQPFFATASARAGISGATCRRGEFSRNSRGKCALNVAELEAEFKNQNWPDGFALGAGSWPSAVGCRLAAGATQVVDIEFRDHLHAKHIAVKCLPNKETKPWRAQLATT